MRARAITAFFWVWGGGLMEFGCSPEPLAIGPTTTDESVDRPSFVGSGGRQAGGSLWRSGGSTGGQQHVWVSSGGGGVPGRTAASGGQAGNVGGSGGGQPSRDESSTTGRAGQEGTAVREVDLGTSPEPGELRMTELFINPAGVDTGREWVEIRNVTLRLLNLVNLHMADRINEARVDWGKDVPVPTLEPGGLVVLLQSVDPTKNGGIAPVPVLSPQPEFTGGSRFFRVASFGTRVSLNNDADILSLCLGPCGSGVVVDQFAWDASPGPEYDDRALVRDDQGRICPATQAFGDAVALGTPGAANGPCP